MMNGTESTAINKALRFLRFCEDAKDYFKENKRHPNNSTFNAKFEGNIIRSLLSIFQVASESKSSYRADAKRAKQVASATSFVVQVRTISYIVRFALTLQEACYTSGRLEA